MSRGNQGIDGCIILTVACFIFGFIALFQLSNVISVTTIQSGKPLAGADDSLRFALVVAVILIFALPPACLLYNSSGR